MLPLIEIRFLQQNQQLSGQQLQSIQLQAPNLGELKRGESQTYLCFLSIHCRPYPITTRVPEVVSEAVTESFSPIDLNPVYNFEKFNIEEDHPQANCPFMGYDFMPREDLFEELDRAGPMSDWGQWEEWGKCNSYSNRQIRLRACVGDRYRCSAKDTYQSRGEFQIETFDSTIFNIFLDCEIPVVFKDDPFEPDRAVIVQIEPETRPYPFSLPEEDSPSERANDFDNFINENDKNRVDRISIPAPGYNLNHCKE